MLVIRTPLYTDLTARGRPAAPRAGGEAFDAGTPPNGGAPPRELTRDDYITKLIKYVPAEVVAAFTGLTAAAAAVGDNAVWWIFAIGILATVGYYYRSAYKLPPTDRPRPYFYVLSVVAFVIWSLAVNESIRGLFDMDARVSEFFLVVGAFLIPFVDEMLTIFYPRLIGLVRRSG